MCLFSYLLPELQATLDPRGCQRPGQTHTGLLSLPEGVIPGDLDWEALLWVKGTLIEEGKFINARREMYGLYYTLIAPLII